MIESSKLTLLY